MRRTRPSRWSTGCRARWRASVFRYPLLVRHPAPLDALRAEIRRLRESGVERIGLIGFSAGGHLAGLAALAPAPTRAKRSTSPCWATRSPRWRPRRYRPARLILLGDDATPELRRATSLDALVTSSSPPFFLWHTAEDPYVPPEHSYRLASSLAAHGVPHSTHVFAHGPTASAWQTARVTPRPGRIWRPGGSENSVNWRCVAERGAHGSHKRTNTGRPADRVRRCSTKRVTGENAIEYAYRELGEGDVPLVLLQHFRGNLDNWDPALVDALAADRRVVAFDNIGVGATTGRRRAPSRRWRTTRSPSSRRWSFEQVDLLGFSLGSFVAQEIALIRPDLVRRVVLASSAPQGAAGMHGWAPEVIGAVGTARDEPEGIPLRLLRPHGDESRGGPAGRRAHLVARTTDRDEPTTWQTRQAQYDAVCAWGIPNHSLLNGSPRSSSRCSSPTATATR